MQRAIGIISIAATIIGFWWTKNIALMCRYNGVHITHATITYLNRIFMFIKRFKKTLPISVLTFIEHVGLNQIILHLHLRPWLACRSDGVSGIKTDFSCDPYLFKTSLYVFIFLLKISSFDGNLILGGWLEFLSMYIGFS